ncbi:hypothetical protein ACMS1V_003326 [Cronobacter dublinensis]
MDNMIAYPGTLMDDDSGMRVVKCYIYKFARERIDRKPRYDAKSKRMTEKKFFWFHTSRPIWTRFHTIENRFAVKDFIRLHQGAGNEMVYFMPQYFPESIQFHNRKTLVYCSSMEDVVNYLNAWGKSDLQNITIIDSKFRWFYDLFEDEVKDAEDNMDVVAYYYCK